MKNQKRASWVLGLLAGAALFTSCYGPMNASSRLATWNREIENRWVGEAVFLPLRIFYVYSVCFLGDILIFNTIEFWGGANPIDPVDPARIEALIELDKKRNG